MSGKNQHYVPRLLLKRWAKAGEDKIRSYAIRAKKIVPAAAIKNQSSSDWTYGKDNFHDSLITETESKSGLVIEHFAKVSEYYQIDVSLKISMMEFVWLQYARTKANMDSYMYLMKGMIENASLPKEVEQKLIDQHDHNDEELVQIIFRAMAVSQPYIFDLKIRILEPREGSYFLLSDNPCIMLNQAFNKRDRSGLGAAKAGLQLILPIDPKALILLYDGDAYKVGYSKKQRHSLRIELSQNDTDIINSLQILNAMNAVYIAPVCQDGDVLNMISNYVDYRGVDKWRYAVSEIVRGDVVEKVVRSCKKDLHLISGFQFSRVKELERKRFCGQTCPVRDELFYREYQKLMAQKPMTPALFDENMEKAYNYQMAKWKMTA